VQIGDDGDVVELRGATIRVSTSGATSAGNIVVSGERVSIAGAEISAITEGSGSAGDINLVASGPDDGTNAAMRISSAAQISSSADRGTSTSATAGTVTLNAAQGTVAILGANQDTTISSAAGAAAGHAGTISVTGQNVSIEDARLTTNVEAADRVGNERASIEVSATGDLVSIADSGLSASTSGALDGGNIEVRGDRISISDGTELKSETTSQGGGAGTAGNIVVSTVPQMASSSTTAQSKKNDPDLGGIAIASSTLSTSTRGAGAAGTITVESRGPLEVSDATVRSESTWIDAGAGAAGELSLSGSQISLVDNTLVSVSIAGGTSDTDRAGIRVTSGQAGPLWLQDSTITTSADQANGGDIYIDAQGPQFFIVRSTIETSAGEQGTGNGGNITIDHYGDVIVAQSQIFARAGRGDGGNITINKTSADALFVQDTESIRSAESVEGNNGTIVIDSPDVDINGALLPSEVELTTPPELSANACRPNAGTTRSTFVREGRGGIAPSAVDYLPATVESANTPAVTVGRTQSTGSAGEGCL
jgi:hypothetical protein